MASIIPQLNEEIKTIGPQLLPDSLLHNNIQTNSMEKYENPITSGHQKIDQVFETEQANYYTSEAEIIKNKFVIGIIPPPGILSGICSATAERLAVTEVSALALKELLGTIKLENLSKATLSLKTAV